MPTPQIAFYFEGDDYFKALEEALSGAGTSVDIELYYFASDRTGVRFADLLIRKAAEGVRIRLIYDSIGCRGTSDDFLLRLDHAGLELKAYHPMLDLGMQLSRRTHRKFFVIDGRAAFLGGFNLADEYSKMASGGQAWRDTGVRMIDHELVGSLQRLFDESWNEVRRHPRDFLGRRPRPTDWGRSTSSAAIVPNYGWQRRSIIRQEYMAAIVHAQGTVFITNSYFIPDKGLQRALRRAAKRGVDVRILTAGESDVPIARWAGQSSYGGLLRAGVRIFEYQGRVLHAKSAVVDDAWYTVGTANLDHLSFFRNHEVNLFGYEGDLGRTLKERFQRDIESSEEILWQAWRKRSWIQKLRERFFFWMRIWL